MSIRTEAGEYLLTNAPDVGLTATIPVVLTNTSTSAVFLEPCAGGLTGHLEKRVSDAWAKAWDPICPLRASAPIRVEPGASYASTFHVRAATAPDAGQRFEVEPIAGTYRIVFRIYASYEPSKESVGQVLSAEQSTSNTFALRN